MSKSENVLLDNHPIAAYVVDRDPIRGYRVASREGREADAHADAALAALDAIGQPDPRGPQVAFRWLGPIEPSRCYVAVWVTMLPSGEARYQQAWYRPARVAKGSAWLWPVLSVALAAVAFGGGVLIERWDRNLLEPVPPIHAPAPVQAKASNEPKLRDVAGPLITAIADADNPVTVLEQFLGQDGIAAPVDDAGNRSGPEVERVVTLTASQEFGKRVPSDKKTFSNYEAAKLLSLFRQIRQFVGVVERAGAAVAVGASPVESP